MPTTVPYLIGASQHPARRLCWCWTATARTDRQHAKSALQHGGARPPRCTFSLSPHGLPVLRVPLWKLSPRNKRACAWEGKRARTTTRPLRLDVSALIFRPPIPSPLPTPSFVPAPCRGALFRSCVTCPGRHRRLPTPLRLLQPPASRRHQRPLRASSAPPRARPPPWLSSRRRPAMLPGPSSRRPASSSATKCSAAR